MNYNFHINDFEGPLDLLLHIVKENKESIYDINISEIIDQYLDFIHSLETKNIDVASEYLVMASELIHLKSKILLNQDDEKDEEFEINSEEELRNKLIMYQQYKDITLNFRELEEKRKDVHTKIPESVREYMDETVEIKSELTVNDLLNAFMSYLQRKEYEKPLETTITKREYSVESRIKSIRELIKSKKKIDFIELFETFNKEYLIVTFLSILEMSKNNEIIITQENNFDKILIELK